MVNPKCWTDIFRNLCKALGELIFTSLNILKSETADLKCRPYGMEGFNSKSAITILNSVLNKVSICVMMEKTKNDFESELITTILF